MALSESSEGQGPLRTQPRPPSLSVSSQEQSLNSSYNSDSTVNSSANPKPNSTSNSTTNTARSSSFAFSSFSNLNPTTTPFTPWASTFRSMSSSLPQHHNPLGASSLTATSVATAAAAAVLSNSAGSATLSSSFPARAGRFASLISPGLYDSARASAANPARRFTSDAANSTSQSFSGTIRSNSRAELTDPVDLAPPSLVQRTSQLDCLDKDQKYIKSVLSEFAPVDNLPDDGIGRLSTDFSRLAPFVGHQSEPTTPPEHRQVRGFPPPLSHPARRVSPTMSMAQVVQSAASSTSNSGNPPLGLNRAGGHALSFSGLGSASLNDNSFANLPSLTNRTRTQMPLTSNGLASMSGIFGSSSLACSDGDGQLASSNYSRSSGDPSRSAFQFSSALADLPRQPGYTADQRSSSVNNLGPIGTSSNGTVWTSVRQRAGRQSLPLNTYVSTEEASQSTTGEAVVRNTNNHRHSMGTGSFSSTVPNGNQLDGVTGGFVNGIGSRAISQNHSEDGNNRVTFSALEALATNNNAFIPTGPLNQYSSDRTLPGLGDNQLQPSFGEGMRAPGSNGTVTYKYGPVYANSSMPNPVPGLGGQAEQNQNFSGPLVPPPEVAPLHPQAPPFTPSHNSNYPLDHPQFTGALSSPTWYDARYSWPPPPVSAQIPYQAQHPQPLQHSQYPQSQPSQQLQLPPQQQRSSPQAPVPQQSQQQQQQSPVSGQRPPRVHGPPIDSQARVIQQRRMANNEENMRFNNAPLETYAGRIYQTSKDQHGCRYLQRKLEEERLEHINLVYDEIKDHVVELMTDPFGNYLCQKILELTNVEQRTVLMRNAAPHIVKIGFNQHGTRALQKMIEYVTTVEQKNLLVSAFKDNVVDLITDLNGNHVIQKCLNHMTTEEAHFIFAAVGEHCVTVGTHRHGCCVLQRCLDHANIDQRNFLIEQITVNAIALVQDAYGNYVVQYVLDLHEDRYTVPLCMQFSGFVPELSRQKFSSNVIEKCIRCSGLKFRRSMVQELMHPKHLEDVVKDQYGNYVIQTAIEYAETDQRAELYARMRPLLPTIRHTSYGRRIVQKLQESNQSVSGSSSNGSGRSPTLTSRRGSRTGGSPVGSTTTSPPRRSKRVSTAVNRRVPVMSSN